MAHSAWPLVEWLVIVALLYIKTKHYWIRIVQKRGLKDSGQIMQQMHENENRYQYQSLKDPNMKTIRLLQILPSRDLNGPIQVALRSTSLTDPNRPRCEALSYC